ncbi:MAG: RNA methyltransferase [Anaerolineae bacterium]|nr:RNA methyltransferase [Anaerolineae bacterium]
MITSTANERIKFVRSLQEQRRARHKSGKFVLEGANLISEAILSGSPIEDAFYTDDFIATPDGTAVLDGLSQAGAVLLAVSDAVMQAMSDTKTPQGILAVLPTPRLAPPAELTFALVIDAVSDPGNMGAIMRVAAAAAVPVMLVTTGTVDLTNPKVVRSAMGAHFRLPVQMLSWEGVAGRLTDHVIFIAESRHGAPYYQVDWSQPSALIVSDEAHGPSPEALQLAHARVTIPMPGGMESLNVAIASSILIFEMLRQRSQSL